MAVLLTASIPGACETPPAPSHAEIHEMVLAAVAQELELAPPLTIHPLPVRLERSASGAFEIGALNPHDSVSIAAVVKLDPSSYRLCTPSASGACPTGDGGVALILSEIQDLERNGLAVIVLVADSRPHKPFQSQYNVRVNRGVRGWSVVELRRSRSPSESRAPDQNSAILVRLMAIAEFGPNSGSNSATAARLRGPLRSSSRVADSSPISRLGNVAIAEFAPANTQRHTILGALGLLSRSRFMRRGSA